MHRSSDGGTRPPVSPCPGSSCPKGRCFINVDMAFRQPAETAASRRDRVAAVLKRAEDAGRAASHVPRGPGKQFAHDTLSSSEELRKYLVATDRLRGVASHLDQRHATRRVYEEYMSSLDRQLSEVAKTRAVLAQAQIQVRPHVATVETNDDGERSVRSERSRSEGSSALEDAGARCLQPANLPRPQVKPKPAPVKPQVVELQPVPCFPRSVGEECPCCLQRLKANDLIMCFPCPAEHVFHSKCLIQWLRTAKSRSTCPMCRAWPRAKQVPSSHPKR
eukprot:Skav201805  [mRNA]  locus=scaffold1071:96711:98366:+ [translate_table: standard]